MNSTIRRASLGLWLGASAFLVQILPAQTAPKLSIHMQTGHAGITITGTVSTLYTIESTANLALTNDWVALTNVVLPTNPWVYMDYNAPGMVKRFYRARTIVQPLAPVISNNLVAYWDASQGVGTVNFSPAWSAATEVVKTWSDVHSKISNDGVIHMFSQSSTTNMPSYLLDSFGNYCIEFPWAYSNNHPDNYLTCSSFPGVTSENVTVYVVASVSDSMNGLSLLAASVGNLMGLNPLQLTIYRKSTLMSPINKAIYVIEADAGRYVFRINNIQQVDTPLVDRELNSLELGGHSASALFSGRIYAALIYSTGHSDQQIQTNVNALASFYSVVTNYTAQACCVGDSITVGIGSTNLQSWPYQLYESCTNVLFYNWGVGGITIGTNGDIPGTTMYSYGPNVDLLLSGSLTNWILIKAGINDMNSGVNPISTFGRLTNYVQARLTAGWNKVAIGTLASEAPGVGPAGVSNYNYFIRSFTLPTNTVIADAGLNATNETRLNDPGNTTYYYDTLHLVNAGYAVIAEHFRLLLNP